jgi:DNA polymerase-3 subunit epsilon
MKVHAMRLITVWIGCAGMSVGAVAAIALALWSYLPGDQRGVALALFQATGSLPYLLVLVALVISGFVAMWIVGAYFSPLARAAEATRLSVAANPGYRLEHAGPRELRDLLAAINTLAARHAASLHDVDIRIAAARADLEHEKNRLAVLMSELAQSVIVCNRDGQIVLYNEQARRLFSQPAAAPQELASGFIGLGRSLYALLPREPVEHAIDLLNARTQVGEFDPVSVFTTRLSSGLLVRVRVAPMAGDDHSQSKSPPPAGFVLLLEDVTQEVIGSERRDQILTGLVERSRASLASLRAATENLAGFPDMDRGPVTP